MAQKLHPCSAPGCDAPISARRILCEHHWARLSNEVRSDIQKFMRIGALGLAVDAIRDFFLEEVTRCA